MCRLLISLALLFTPCEAAEDPLARALARWSRAYAAGKIQLAQPADRGPAAAVYRGALPRYKLRGMSHQFALQSLLTKAEREGTADVTREIVGLAAIGLDGVPRSVGRAPYRVRDIATDSLGRMQRADALHLIARTAAGEDEPWGRDWTPALQAAALRGLGRSGRAVFRPQIEQQLECEHRIVRLSSAEALGQLHRRQSLLPLTEALGREKDPVITLTTVGSIHRILRAHHTDVDTRDLRDVVRAMIAALGRTDWRTDVAVVEVLEEFRSVEAIPALIAVLERFDGTSEAPSGFLRARTHEALYSLTGTLLPADQPAEWRAFWEREKDGFVVPKAREADGNSTAAGGFFGIPVQGTRVVFVIDLSGSMNSRDIQVANTGAETRLDVAKRQLLRAVDELPPDAFFNVVGFASGVSAWRSGLTSANDAAKAALRQRFQTVQAKGSTNLWGGLEKALGIEATAYGQGFEQVIDELFLLSDGSPTAGDVTSTEEILELVQETNRFSRVRIHTVFIGGGESEFMRRLAEENGGRHVMR